MFSRKKDFEPFENKVWLASPTMHDGAEMKYVKEAYDTNWMSTVGANINEVEKVAAEKSGVKYAVALSCCTAALHLCVKFAGEKLYGKPEIGHGAVEGKRVFCSDMTFDATLNPVVYEGGIPVFVDTEKDKDIVNIGLQFIKTVAPFYIFITAKLSADGVLRGAGDMKEFMVTTFADLLLRVLFSFMLVSSLGYIGIYWAFPIGWVIGTVLSLYYYAKGNWKNTALVRRKKTASA